MQYLDIKTQDLQRKNSIYRLAGLLTTLLLAAVMQVHAETPDSLYYRRLKKIERQVRLDFNEDVHAVINRQMDGERDISQVILTRSIGILPVIEAAVSKTNLPAELKYLPIALSGLNEIYMSKEGGTGLWNLQYMIARRYGLTVNQYVDERRDIRKSTAAALLYFSDLHALYNNWSFDILAFVSSPSEVNAAIGRCSGVKDFWKVYAALHTASKERFLRFISAAYLMNYYKDHNMQQLPGRKREASQTFTVVKDIYISDLAAMLGITEQSIREINPLYRSNVIPAGMQLTLPEQTITRYKQVEESLYANGSGAVVQKEIAMVYQDYFAENKVVVQPVMLPKTSTTVKTSNVVHKVAKGDNLGRISMKYNVSVAEVKKWNSLKSDLIYVGQRLIIKKEEKVTVPVKTETHVPVQTETVTTEPPVKSTGETMVTVTPPVKNTTTTTTKPVWLTHKVRSGDSVWGIANKYKVTEDAVRKNNHLSGNTIHPGQVLKIKKR